MATPPVVAHYISGTHWDREWYRPFQEFRYLLVKLLDGLIDLMESNPEFRYFNLDGQTCVLEDYMAIRPERRERLARLIREGRILIGPWYTMPDLFCVGDEALIRNLLLGRRICREWGAEPMPVGFICDMFGHPSQIPQIFAGFGIRDVLLGRGTNESTTPMFFEWEAPDGSRSFVFKLQDAQGYGAFAVPRTFVEAEAFSELPAAFEAELASAGDDAQRTAVRERYFREALAAYVKHELARSGGSPLCLMDALDHIPPATDVAFYLRQIREACPEVEPRHSSLPLFFAEARRNAGAVPRRRGELREPSRNRCAYLWLIPNCVSSRVRLKQANDECQNLLGRWAEPLVALANRRGAGIPGRFLAAAWEQVLSNHAHDSICGCSIDQVHRDMRYRYEQAQTLSLQLRHQAIGALTAEAADLARGPHEFTLTLVNPLPTRRRESVAFDIDLPTDWPTDFCEGFNGQRVKAFLLETEAGEAIDYQLLEFAPNRKERSRHARFCYLNAGPFHRFRVAATLDLPPCGFLSLRVKPSAHPVRSWGTLRTGPLAGRNERLAFAVTPAGTVTLTDLQSGEVYTDLLLFEDCAETGDGWFHVPSVNDRKCLSAGCPVQTAVVHDGPERLSFRIEAAMRVPARFDEAAESRSEEAVTLRVSSLVTLRRGADMLEVETTIENTAEDHQLKLLLPTDAAGAKTWFAHHPYDFVERPVALDAQTRSWREAERTEKPFLGLQAVGDGRRGLAFLAPAGLHEGGVLDDTRRTIQVTMLRSFRRTVGTSNEEDGLEKGRITLRYALLPFSGPLPRAHALDHLARLQAGITTRQTGSRASGFPAMAGRGLATRDFLEFCSDTLVVSTIKPAEEGEGIILRVWNPEETEGRGEWRFAEPPTRIEAVSLAETPLPGDAAKLEGATARVLVPAHGMVTLRAFWG